MCGRYSLQVELETLLDAYGIAETSFSWEPAQEIFPTNQVPVVIKREPKRMGLLPWGFPLSNTKKPVINARIETLQQKPLFKKPFLQNRCLLPANGFFEWKQEESQRIKYFINTVNMELFSMAGLYQAFKTSDNNLDWRVVIITASSRGRISEIHPRMPLLVSSSWEDKWLDPDYSDLDKLQNFLQEDLTRWCEQELQAQPLLS